MIDPTDPAGSAGPAGSGCREAAGSPPNRPTPRPAPRRDWTDDTGQMGGVEVIPFALLVFIVGTLLVAQAWAVVDVKFAVDAAAREGVRTFVESPDEASAVDAGRVAATEAVTAHGRDADQLVIDAPTYGSGTFERCALVTYTVRYPVPALTLPWIGGRGEAFTVTASHAEIIDPYRSGLATGGGC